MCLLRRYCRHAFKLKLKLIVTTPPPPKVCSCRKWIEISHNNEILQAARKMFRPCKNLIPSLLTANVREIPKSILVNVSVFRNVPWRLLQNCTQITPLIIEVLSIVNKFFQFQTLLLKLIYAHRCGSWFPELEIYHCWNWYGSDLQTLEDQAQWVLKKFHDLDPR